MAFWEFFLADIAGSPEREKLLKHFQEQAIENSFFLNCFELTSYYKKRNGFELFISRQQEDINPEKQY